MSEELQGHILLIEKESIFSIDSQLEQKLHSALQTYLREKYNATLSVTPYGKDGYGMVKFKDCIIFESQEDLVAFKLKYTDSGIMIRNMLKYIKEKENKNE